MRFETLDRPYSVSALRDGGAYLVPGLAYARTNLFLEIAYLDELFVKLPSARGISDYHRFIRLAEPSVEDIRAIEEQERFENLQYTLEGFPDLVSCMSIDPALAHYLAVHKLQYERLRRQTAVLIPQARFGMMGASRFSSLRAPRPALYQERVHGTTLWDMFDFTAVELRPRWRSFLPAISTQLSNLLDSGLLNHLDWNIQNFVFSEDDQRLCYVDLKPTIYVARSSNEHNLEGIRSYFIV